MCTARPWHPAAPGRLARLASEAMVELALHIGHGQPHGPRSRSGDLMTDELLAGGSELHAKRYVDLPLSLVSRQHHGR